MNIKKYKYYTKKLILSLDGEVTDNLEGVDFESKSVISERINYKISEVKPHFRSLSDINKYFLVNGERVNFQEKLFELTPLIKLIDESPNKSSLCFLLDWGEWNYTGNLKFDDSLGIWLIMDDNTLNRTAPKFIWDFLCEHNFDVFGELEKNNAIKIEPIDG